jgi:hypothetical protein
VTGAQGPKGDKGDKGDTGAQGPAGINGTGIDEVWIGSADPITTNPSIELWIDTSV